MRKVSIWYLKSFPNAKRIRENLSVVNGREKMIEFIDSIGEDEIAHRIPDIQYENAA